ncbi:poly [ADP-ribose] polymerase tankyrase-1-like [Schistocerca americana]|uniref:poly [ADP-ribose] polymerase tankyrase-1-like n=1 Tax=Schistocerca americana TaxID=7009 RepID=UPI001F4FB8E7|nr:poly [ADP-ribose] polymerase tankyrase-1-like [Schistocerca americana]
MEAIKDITETAAVDLGDLLDAGDGAVVILEAGDTRLLAHRAVLVDRSPVFAAMFAHDTLEASSGAVSIPDVGGPVLRQLVSYLYTLQAPQLPGMAPQLLAAADKYGVSRLKAECERQVAAQLTVETAAAAATLAVRHSCSDLRRTAIEFIKTHTHEVMATQGWADAMRKQPEDLIKVSRLLYDPPPRTSAPTATITTATATTASTPCQPPAAAAPPTSPPPGQATVSRICPPAATQLGPTTTTATTTATAAATTTTSTSTTATTSTSATTNTTAATSTSTTTATSTASTTCQRLAATVLPMTPPPNEATVSLMQSISAEERSRKLIEAAKEGLVEQLRALLLAGTDVHGRDRDRRTALHWAAIRGHLEAASSLVGGGSEVNAKDSWHNTPLHLAARSGHGAVVWLLLGAYADPNARNQWGSTPLHRAAIGGHIEAAAALMQAGADTEARDEDGETPLDLAWQNNKHQLVDLLTRS